MLEGLPLDEKSKKDRVSQNIKGLKVVGGPHSKSEDALPPLPGEEKEETAEELLRKHREGGQMN